MSINICTLGTSVAAASWTYATIVDGTPNTLRDGVTTGDYGIQSESLFDRRIIGTATITFAEAADITSVESVHKYRLYPSSSYAYVQLYYDGAWTTVLSLSGASFNQQVANGSWEGVTKIRYNVYAPHEDPLPAGVFFYELRAFGTVAASPEEYDDEGIRMYDGDDMISLAMRDATDDDPLRIYTGEVDEEGDPVIKAFILVATDDDYASKFRVETESDGIKSLRKL